MGNTSYHRMQINYLGAIACPLSLLKSLSSVLGHSYRHQAGSGTQVANWPNNLTTFSVLTMSFNTERSLTNDSKFLKRRKSSRAERAAAEMLLGTCVKWQHAAPSSGGGARNGSLKDPMLVCSSCSSFSVSHSMSLSLLIPGRQEGENTGNTSDKNLLLVKGKGKLARASWALLILRRRSPTHQIHGHSSHTRGKALLFSEHHFYFSLQLNFTWWWKKFPHLTFP